MGVVRADTPPDPSLEGTTLVRDVVREVPVYDEARAVEEGRATTVTSGALAREHGKVTNDEVQLVLGVPDRTASWYLSLIVRQGRLKKLGRGRGAYYVLP
jgi:predicted HTH transcriptional regulator